MKSRQHSARWLGLALAGITINFAASSQAASHPRPPSPSLEPGTIYYYNYTGSGLWRMNPDGKAKTQLSVIPSDGCVPSRALHGDRRWFLVFQPVGGFYPEVGGTQWARQELFAFSDRGESVQLTDDPTFQPNGWVGPIPLWTLAPGEAADSRMTFLGRRWNIDGTAITELGLFAIDVNPEQLPASVGGNLALIPALLPISLTVTFEQSGSSVFGYSTSVYGYDWSPKGTEIVFAQEGALHIAAIDGATPARVLLSDTAAWATEPRWSPRSAGTQTQILFATASASGSPTTIESIHYDGTGRFTVVPPSTDNGIGRFPYTWWSPGGGFFLYAEFDLSSPWKRSCDIVRVTADGSSRTVLTKDTADWCYPGGWRLP